MLRAREGHPRPALGPHGRTLRQPPSGPSGTISLGVIVLFLVLFLLVALALASFFQHMLAAFLVLLALPVFALLHALIGTFYAAFAIAIFAIFIALVQTITSSLSLLREANSAPARGPRHTEARRSNRSRIAA